jgi:hypothetical protein
MNDQEIEQLLSEEEGTALDFKRDQYPFVDATDDQKSELLKDILAFANSWRRTSAYIVIGVDEDRAKRTSPPGIVVHLDDADLQQFVNSKTNRPVEFSYRSQTYRGKELGIIEVPLQERPVFLTKGFGRLKKDTVYVRRGSSTDEADPSEIARMGSSDARMPMGQPNLDLQFADLKTRKLFGSTLTINSVCLQPRLNLSRLKPTQEYGTIGFASTIVEMNPHFHEELVEYVATSALLIPVGLALTNDSGVPARTAELRIQLPRQDGLHVVDESDMPPCPSKHLTFSANIPSISDIARAAFPDPHVSAYSSYYEIVVHFGNVLPKSTVWTSGVFFVGAEVSLSACANARIYAENLANPLSIRLEILIRTDVKPMSMELLQPFL